MLQLSGLYVKPYRHNGVENLAHMIYQIRPKPLLRETKSRGAPRPLRFLLPKHKALNAKPRLEGDKAESATAAGVSLSDRARIM